MRYDRHSFYRNNLLLFIVIFFLVFGFKISFIDLSILIPACVLLTLSTLKRVYLSKDYLLIISIVMLLFCYQTLLQITNNNFDLANLFRLVRAILTIIIVLLIIDLFPDKESSLNVIINCIVFHSGMITVSAIFPDINKLFSILSGNEKNPILRSSGLLAGFDIAGLVCFMGMVILYFTQNNYRVKGKAIKYTALIIGSLFTSRVSLVLTFLFTAFIIFNKVAKIKRFYFKVVIYSIITPILLLSVFSILYVALVSIGMLSNPTISAFFINSYSSNSGQVLSSMFFLPPSENTLIFGTGIETYNSDVGYVKDIFRFGIFGTIVSFIVYILVVAKSSFNKWIVFLLFVTLILNFKNSYFFVRSILPLFLMASYYFSFSKVNKYENSYSNSI